MIGARRFYLERVQPKYYFYGSYALNATTEQGARREVALLLKKGVIKEERPDKLGCQEEGKPVYYLDRLPVYHYDRTR